MSTYYVDLALNSATGTPGTNPLAPWAWDDLKTKPNSATHTHTILMIGSRSVTVPIQGATSEVETCFGTRNGSYHATFDKWGSDPWRIRITNTTDFPRFWSNSFHNGIFDIVNTQTYFGFAGQYLNNYSTTNMIIICNRSTFAMEAGKFYGCTFITGAQDVNIRATFPPANPETRFVDCKFISNGVRVYDLTTGHKVGFTNCAFKCPRPTKFDNNYHPGITTTYCQYNWSAPAQPAWNADKSAFVESVLSAGISTPPQPGNPSYSGFNKSYDTDPWGNPRDSIGAVYNDSYVPPMLDHLQVNIADVTYNNVNWLYENQSGTHNDINDALVDFNTAIQAVSGLTSEGVLISEADTSSVANMQWETRNPVYGGASYLTHADATTLRTNVITQLALIPQYLQNYKDVSVRSYRNDLTRSDGYTYSAGGVSGLEIFISNILYKSSSYVEPTQINWMMSSINNALDTIAGLEFAGIVASTWHASSDGLFVGVDDASYNGVKYLSITNAQALRTAVMNAIATITDVDDTNIEVEIKIAKKGS